MTDNLPALPERDDNALRELEWLKGFEVGSNEDLLLLDQKCEMAKEWVKKGEQLYREAIQDAHKTHKGLLAKLDSFCGPSKEFRQVAIPKMDAYRRVQEALRQRQEDELRAKAKRLAEDQALAQAEAAEAAGEREEAEAILETPVFTPPVILPKSTPKLGTTIRRVPDLDKLQRALDEGTRNVPGVTYKQVWTFKVTDTQALPESYKKPC